MKRTKFYRIAMLAVMLVAWVGASAQTVVCTASNVRLRTGPSTSYPMLVWTASNKPVYINKGQSLTYLAGALRSMRLSIATITAKRSIRARVIASTTWGSRATGTR